MIILLVSAFWYIFLVYEMQNYLENSKMEKKKCTTIYIFFREKCDFPKKKTSFWAPMLTSGRPPTLSKWLIPSNLYIRRRQIVWLIQCSKIFLVISIIKKKTSLYLLTHTESRLQISTAPPTKEGVAKTFLFYESGSKIHSPMCFLLEFGILLQLSDP